MRATLQRKTCINGNISSHSLLYIVKKTLKFKVLFITVGKEKFIFLLNYFNSVCHKCILQAFSFKRIFDI